MSAFDNLFQFGTATKLDDEQDPTSAPDFTDFDGGPPPPSPGGGLSCEVCGVGLVYKGRGRKPTRCDDHKTRTGSGSGAKQTRTGRAKSNLNDPRLREIAGDLTFGAGQFVGIIAPVTPVTAVTMAGNAPGAIDALVKIAADNPKMLAGLEMVAKTMPWMECGKFAASIGYALMVDMGQANPYGIAGEYLGVAKAAESVGWKPPAPKDQRKQSQTADPNGAAQPPKFNLVPGIVVR